MDQDRNSRRPGRLRGQASISAVTSTLGFATSTTCEVSGVAKGSGVETLAILVVFFGTVGEVNEILGMNERSTTIAAAPTSPRTIRSSDPIGFRTFFDFRPGLRDRSWRVEPDSGSKSSERRKLIRSSLSVFADAFRSPEDEDEGDSDGEGPTFDSPATTLAVPASSKTRRPLLTDSVLRAVSRLSRTSAIDCCLPPGDLAIIFWKTALTCGVTSGLARGATGSACGGGR